MSWSLRIRLSLMMFLQYAVWGAWAPVLYPYLVNPTPEMIAVMEEEESAEAGDDASADADTEGDADGEEGKEVEEEDAPPPSPGLGFTATQASWVFSALWLACILAPFTGGQIADRYVATQWFLAAMHLIGAAFLYWMAVTNTFGQMMTYMGVYCLLYAPTLALTNSLCFHHIKNVERDFGLIRVFGTLGWIAAGYMLTIWRGGVLYNVVDTKSWLDTEPMIDQGDSLLLAAGLSLALGVLCLVLPHTPPKKEGQNPLAFVEAFAMLKDRNFLAFMLIAFVVTTELQFYYLPTGKFLEDIGVTSADVPTWLTLAQVAEIGAMVLLPFVLPKVGIRKALAIGVIAWPLRYAVFAYGEPLGLVLASLTLHGIGYTFFFVVSQMYVDEVAPEHIRASAQGLLTMATLGVGNFLGTLFTGAVLDYCVKEDGAQDWVTVFLVPCALTVACAIAFLLFFKDPARSTEAETSTA